MTITVTPSESAALSTLGNYFDVILPSGVPSIVGQENRVAEPPANDFVIMTPVRRKRLSTNIDTFIDAKMTGSITGATMTVSSVTYGRLKVGSVIFGVNVANGTSVIAFGSGSGGIGTYTVSPSQTIGSETLAAGVLDALQPTELTIQVDVHGPSSGDNVQRISTMMRDDYAVRYFLTQNSGNIIPFYADDPKQIPFINENSQYENRWVVEACLQVNATVNDIPQQFFDQIVVTLIPADIFYPA